MGKMYGKCLRLKDFLPKVKEFVFPSSKEKAMPPHTTVGALAFVCDCVANHKASPSSGPRT